MKRLDKLILQSFIGPFVLTFAVVVFILLMQFLLKYFDELVGKNLGIAVYAELLFFFSINLTAMALPLAVLLSSLMTYGNLGEHFELTAIKSAGISLTRTLLPIFIFSVGLSLLALFNNDQIVPKANLYAYSLLYDIRQTKPALSLQEGSFYNGIPNYSIKANEKFSDGISLKGLMIYDHSKGRGNTDVILADSGRMYTFNNDRYMMLEMYDGESYSETSDQSSRPYKAKNEPSDFIRNRFKKSKIIFSLESFGMDTTNREYFKGNRVMKNLSELSFDLDSMQNRMIEARYNIFQNAGNYLTYGKLTKAKTPKELEKAYHVYDSLQEIKRLKQAKADSLARLQKLKMEMTDSTEADIKARLKKEADNSSLAYASRMRAEKGNLSGPSRKSSNPVKSVPVKEVGEMDSNRISRFEEEPRFLKRPEEEKTAYVPALADTTVINEFEKRYEGDPGRLKDVYKSAIGQVRYTKNNYDVYGSRAEDLQRNYYLWEIELHKKYAQAAACLVMFLIGAPLGAIIKRGGLGVPVIISIAFFIIYYVLTMFGDKWAREGIISPEVGVWAANVILLPFGIIFLIQARNDARLFESDFYSVWVAKFRALLGEKVKRPELLKNQETPVEEAEEIKQ